MTQVQSRNSRPDDEFVASADAIAAEVGGETVILDMLSGVYYSLNPLGTVIWSSLREPTPRSAVVDAVMSRVSHPPDQQIVSADVGRFLDEMVKLGLVRPPSGSGEN